MIGKQFFNPTGHRWTLHYLHNAWTLECDTPPSNSSLRSRALDKRTFCIKIHTIDLVLHHRLTVPRALN
ncbi:hypothetical protein LENED_005638 [Lentinula edodes]|uniref:Uncharacterized protein n=1 Tax=Lentinula edodes TaxID=5353 RepID=A0A1Q3E9W1_LENED|nr:hypothetical protein LENED_005638 [Lentinula edodes]